MAVAIANNACMILVTVTWGRTAAEDRLEMWRNFKVPGKCLLRSVVSYTSVCMHEHVKQFRVNSRFVRVLLNIRWPCLLCAVKALTTLVKSFPSRMAEYLPQILDPVWLALTHSAETYPFMLHILDSRQFCCFRHVICFSVWVKVYIPFDTK